MTIIIIGLWVLVLVIAASVIVLAHRVMGLYYTFEKMERIVEDLTTAIDAMKIEDTELAPVESEEEYDAEYNDDPPSPLISIEEAMAAVCAVLDVTVSSPALTGQIETMVETRLYAVAFPENND
jgi:hypothetical protein